jgi:hypothetical protein
MMIEYKEIKKEHGNLGKFLSSLLKQKYEDWGKYQKLFNGIEYDSWEEFEGAIKELNKYLEDNNISSNANPPLYRGQRCGKWGLETTLERYTDKKYTITSYLQLIQSAKWAFESHFGKGYGADDIDFGKIEFEIGKPHPYCQLLPYFRHLGFPSPLLDWTRSFYVAAYFAFCDADPKKDDKSVAVYNYTEHFGRGKHIIPSEGFVDRIGRNIATHKRHYLQQAEYTYALIIGENAGESAGASAMGVFFQDGNKVTYINHYETIKNSMGEIGTQDVCVKHLIPITEKDEVINRLYSMNINEYSLFHTEESLMKTVAYERIRRKKQF